MKLKILVKIIEKLFGMTDSGDGERKTGDCPLSCVKGCKRGCLTF